MIAFTKMQTLGNDFVIINMGHLGHISTDWVKQLCDRHLGIGCDQLLTYRVMDEDNPTFKYHIFNADGGEVEQCGNGALSLSQHLFAHVLQPETTELFLQTCNRNIHAKLDDGRVHVNMGTPLHQPDALPMTGPERERYEIQTPWGRIPFHAVSMGNPHAIIPQDSVSHVDLKTLGEAFNTNPQFPKGVNVSILRVDGPSHIAIKVFERGVGPTLACGSAASASGYIAHRYFECDPSLQVELPGGTLHVQIDGNSVWLSGPTQTVFQGEYLH